MVAHSLVVVVLVTGRLVCEERSCKLHAVVVTSLSFSAQRLSVCLPKPKQGSTKLQKIFSDKTSSSLTSVSPREISVSSAPSAVKCIRSVGQRLEWTGVVTGQVDF